MLNSFKNNIFFTKSSDLISCSINKQLYPKLLDIVLNNSKNDLYYKLKDSNLLFILNYPNEIIKAIDKSIQNNFPYKSSYYPESINLELTTFCPLKCPQCYVHLEPGKYIDKDFAISIIKECGQLHTSSINLSGGETMAYPYIFDLVKACNENNVFSNIAISGYNFDEIALNKFINYNIGAIYVSLNGSTKEINSKTRDGFDLAINALKILNKSTFDNYYINWVAHDYNISDLENMVKLAKKFNCKGLVVLAFKPDSQNKLNGAPTYKNFINLKNQIINYNSDTFNDDIFKIHIEDCYSSLVNCINNEDTINENAINKEIPFGCSAGLSTMSVSVDGYFTPCRHINEKEKFNTILDYWTKSKFLNKLRHSHDDIREPCFSCKFSNTCCHCAAINYKINNDLYIGNEYCPINDIN